MLVKTPFVIGPHEVKLRLWWTDFYRSLGCPAPESGVLTVGVVVVKVTVNVHGPTNGHED